MQTASGRYEGKLALVTGGSRGIGRAISQQLASQGAEVIVNFAREPDAAKELVTEIEHAGGRAQLFQANLVDAEAVAELFETIRTGFSSLDILVNNAGFGAMRPVDTLPLRHFDRTIDLNVRAVLDCSQRAAALMRMGGRGGKIVNISSVGSIRVLPLYAAVGVSKAALETLTRYLAVELAADGISVNAVCAGPVRTDALRHFPNATNMLNSALDQTPAGSLTTAQEVASVVDFLCSDAADKVRGQTIVVDGGLTLTTHVY
jgi:enoyl-[acyl-carrier protein] reductase III